MQGKVTLSKTDQRKAVNRTFTLIKNGTSITDARRIVAGELNLSPNTLLNWQNRFKMSTPVITQLTNVSNTTVMSRQKVIKTKQGNENWRGNLGTVFASLIRKDGDYSHQDASAISQIANAALGQAKYDLEVHKLAEATTSKRAKSLDHLAV